MHDFQVWIYERDTAEGWRISHKEIMKDIREKLRADRNRGRLVIEALQRVHGGADPEEILNDYYELVRSLPGLSLELILKAYKWIFGQEDCNYPPPHEGRDRAMNGILELLSETN